MVRRRSHPIGDLPVRAAAVRFGRLTAVTVLCHLGSAIGGATIVDRIRCEVEADRPARRGCMTTDNQGEALRQRADVSAALRGCKTTDDRGEFLRQLAGVPADHLGCKTTDRDLEVVLRRLVGAECRRRQLVDLPRDVAVQGQDLARPVAPGQQVLARAAAISSPSGRGAMGPMLEDPMLVNPMLEDPMPANPTKCVDPARGCPIGVVPVVRKVRGIDLRCAAVLADPDSVGPVVPGREAPSRSAAIGDPIRPIAPVRWP